MAITFEASKDIPTDVDAVVVPAVVGAEPADGLDAGYLRAIGFEGGAEQVATVPCEDGRVRIVVGMGAAEDVDASVVRRAAAVAGRTARRHGSVATTLLDALPAGAEAGLRAEAAQALAEGFALGTYEFDRYRSSGDEDGDGGGTATDRLSRVVVAGARGGKRVTDAIDRGAAVAAGVAFARDLVNEPGGTLTPSALADAAVALGEREGLDVTVLDEHAIGERGMGGLLGVNRGSAQPPRFIRVAYEPSSPRGTLALVGKGITFDSGGLSIKTATGMMTMKDDMGGAAAILGAFAAIGAVAPKARVVGFIPATDNMTGPDATRPGDVLRISDGTTVEVLNTDAEGRLILADGLVAASDEQPDAIVDLATLTGAAITALGNRIAALMGNHGAWLDQVRDAAARAGERVWELPLPDDYRKRLDSDIADLRNIGRTGDGGTITAGLFLEHFVGEGIPWAHLDIAGPAWSDEVDGEVVKGGTGWGVRTILELARAFRRPR